MKTLLRTRVDQSLGPHGGNFLICSDDGCERRFIRRFTARRRRFVCYCVRPESLLADHGWQLGSTGTTADQSGRLLRDGERGDCNGAVCIARADQLHHAQWRWLGLGDCDGEQRDTDDDRERRYWRRRSRYVRG